MKYSHLVKSRLAMIVVCCVATCVTASSSLAKTADFEVKVASKSTIDAQKKMMASLPEDDGRDVEFATRGFIATLKDPIIRNDQGEMVWDNEKYSWVKGDAPDTVNPSLWRHMKILAKHGLFQVVDGVWQVRGLDPANMLIIKGETGWVIVDSLYNKETAKAAIGLVNEHLGERPVTGVIYTHSHSDHSGGVRGVIGDGDVPVIIAPDKLIEETASEFILAGNSMGRRVVYQFGMALEPNPQGIVGGGIVKDTTTNAGHVTLIPPTDYIKKTGEIRVVDGVKIEFQMVPETEAPAEMNLFLPEQKLLYVSEIVSCTMHNVQTPRGAKARDVLSWAGYLTEAIDRYAESSDALATGHCWPRFGKDEVIKHLSLQRDNYKFIHDQTVRMMNNGDTPIEIADKLKPLPDVANEWSNRSYYGNLRHNAKGVYLYYSGWWDGIPAHLDMLSPVEQGKRYVAAIGGARKLLKVADKAMKAGEYRWSSELLNHLVFSDPSNDLAKAKLADSYEQMGYQDESAIRRNFYLTGAAELRGLSNARSEQSVPDMFKATPMGYFLELIAARLNPATIGDTVMAINIDVTDTGDIALMTLDNAVMVNRLGKASPNPDISIKGSKAAITALFLQNMAFEKLTEMGLEMSGDLDGLKLLQQSIETPPLDFNIVVP